MSVHDGDAILMAQKLAADVELLDYQAHKRLCHTCCDLYDCTQRMGRN